MNKYHVFELLTRDWNVNDRWIPLCKIGSQNGTPKNLDQSCTLIIPYDIKRTPIRK